jgi:hypothetical protein
MYVCMYRAFWYVFIISLYLFRNIYDGITTPFFVRGEMLYAYRWPGVDADGYVALLLVPIYRPEPHDSPLQIWEGSGDVIVLSGTPPNLASSEALL